MKSLAPALLAVVLAIQSGPSTSLRLSFRGPNGETIRPDRVTLLLDWWGGGERLTIPVTESTATINFELKQFPGGYTSAPNEPSRILVEAKGYVSVMSEPFDWPKSPLPTTIRFGDRAVTVDEGDARSLQLTLRRPQPKSLRFLDQDGTPVPDLTVNVFRYWTDQNHCGVFEGDIIARAITDREGRIAIPDGDFDHGIALPNGADGVVFDHEGVFYQRVIKAVEAETTTSVLRFKRRTVVLDVFDGDQPVAGVRVAGMDRFTGCMDPGIRPFGVTDQAGRLTVPSFSTEQYRDIVICREHVEAWRGSTAEVTKSPFRIQLQPNYHRDPTMDPCALEPNPSPD